MDKWKRRMALFLVMALLFSLFPTSIFAKATEFSANAEALTDKTAIPNDVDALPDTVKTVNGAETLPDITKVMEGTDESSVHDDTEESLETEDAETDDGASSDTGFSERMEPEAESPVLSEADVPDIGSAPQDDGLTDGVTSENAGNSGTDAEIRMTSPDADFDVVTYNLLECPIAVGFSEELASSDDNYRLFDGNGNYTIELQPDAFFPYEVQFSYHDRTWTEWFVSEDDTVTVAGHTFMVHSEAHDPYAIRSITAMVSGVPVTVYPTDKKFSDEPNASLQSDALFNVNEEYELNLTQFIPDELKSISLETIINGMEQRYNWSEFGEKPTANEIAVWAKGSYFSSDEGYMLLDGNAIDLSDDSWFSDDSIYLDLVAGSADQLNPNNRHYEIAVTVSEYKDLFDAVVYSNETPRKQIPVYDIDASRSIFQGRNIWEYYVGVDSYAYKEATQSEGETFLGLSFKSAFSGFEATVYEGLYETVDAIPTDATEITDLINQENIAVTGGHLADYYSDEPEVTIVLKRNGAVVGVLPMIIDITRYARGVSVSDLRDSQGTSVRKTSNWKTENHIETQTITLRKGYAANAQYYVKFHASDPDPDKEYDNRWEFVQKAVVGHFDSLQQAQSVADIKEQLFADYSAQGYPSNFSTGVEFTFFGDRDDVHHIRVVTVAGDEEEPVYESDPSLYVSGAKDLSSFSMQSGDDSYYRYGYQTIFLTKKEGWNQPGKPVTQETIIPTFSVSHDETVFATADPKEAGKPQVSGQTEIPFVSGNPVQYTVALDGNTENKTRNYWVTFLTQEEGKHLYVNAANDPARMRDGMPVREMVLSSGSSNYYHDVFVANYGTEDISNLYAYLIFPDGVTEDQKTVKLNDYWSFRDNSEHSLKAFDTSDSSYNASHADMMAKVRIEAIEGKVGAINAVLVIGYGDKENPNDDEVRIQLTGFSGDFTIVTENVEDSVMYVPYSNMIQTSFMLNDFGSVKFTMSKGKLPTGMVLKDTGELYGVPRVPTEIGEKFTFTASATFTYESKSLFDVPIANSSAKVEHEYTFELKTNSDENVNAETAKDGEEFKVNIWVPDMTLTSDQIVQPGTRLEEEESATRPHVDLEGYRDIVFESNGSLGMFVGFWLDGQKLEEGVHYDTPEEGSSRIPIRAQTFKDAGEGTHTISGEYREGGSSDLNSKLRRTAQNYTVEVKKSDNGDTKKDDGNTGRTDTGRTQSSSSSSGNGAAVYSVKTTSSGGGTVSVNRKSAPANKTIIVSLKANAGYEITGVTVRTKNGNNVPTSGNGAEYSFSMPKSNVTVTGQFRRITYTVSVEKNGNGIVRVSPTSAPPGNTVGIATVPDKGWITQNVSVTNSAGNPISYSGDSVNRTFTMPSGAVTVRVTFAMETLGEFVDINGPMWFFEDAKWALNRGIINGVTTQYWEPQTLISSVTAVVTLARMSDADIEAYWGDEYNYPWIPVDWYTAAARWAAASGFLTENIFTGTEPISRAGLAVMLEKYLLSQGVKVEPPESLREYPDAVKVEEMSRLLDEDVNEALQILNSVDVFRGLSDGSMNPDKYSTRAHLVALLHRLSDFIISYWP